MKLTITIAIYREEVNSRRKSARAFVCPLLPFVIGLIRKRL